MATSYTRRINLYINGKEVRNDISSITKEFNKASAELRRMDVGSKAYNSQLRKVAGLKSILNDHNAELRKNTNALQDNKNRLGSLLETAKGLLPAFGFGAMVALGKKTFDNLVAATQGFGDSYRATMGAMNGATSYFWKTLSGGDWSNFFTNIKEAARLGREYVMVLDDIGDRQKGLRIEEADARARILQLEEDLKNQGLTKEQRLAAGQERIRIEEELAEKRAALARKAFDNETQNNIKLSQIGRDRFIQLQTDWDSEDRKSAEVYAKQLQRLEALKKEQGMNRPQFQGTFSQTNFSEEIRKLNDEIARTPDHIKQYGQAVRVFNDINDEERERLVSTYEAMKTAENSAVENTKRITTMVNSLIAETEKGKREALERTIAAIEKAPEISQLIEADLETQRAAMAAYFETVGEGAFEAFLAGIERAQQEKSFIVEIPIKEEEIQDLDVDYALQKFAETEQGKRNILEASFAAGKISRQEYEDEQTRITLEAEERRMQIMQEKADRASQLTQLGSNLVQSMMDFELEKAGQNEAKKAAIRKKYANMQFAVSAAEIIVNTASAIMKGFSQLGPIGGAIAAGILGATGAIQLGIANAQRAKVAGFATGGYTTPGEVNQPAGIVHAGEWVAPQTLVNHRVAGPVISMLEGMRPKVAGFADGGYTSPGPVNQPAGIVHAGEWVAPQTLVGHPIAGGIISMLEGMRTNGSYINPEVLNSSLNYRNSYAKGGFVSSSTVSASDPANLAILNEIKAALNENTKATLQLMRWKPTVAAEAFERELNIIHDIKSRQKI